MYLTIALTLWFIHYLYFTRSRNRYKILLFVDKQFVHEYRSNILPNVGQAIYVTVNGIRKAYWIKNVVLRIEDGEEINLSVIDLNIDFNALHAKNPAGKPVPEQEDNSTSTGARSKGERDPNQDR